MKADERISDVIRALQVEDQPCRRVQHRLESAQKVGYDADLQHAVVVVRPGVHQNDDQHLERGRWHAPTDLAKLTQRSETARYRSLNMRSHRQVISRRTNRGRDRNANDQYCPAHIALHTVLFALVILSK